MFIYKSAFVLITNRGIFFTLLIINFVYFLFLAPSAGPENLRLDAKKTHDTLTLHWNPPPSNKIHGDLLTYSVFYQLVRVGGLQLSTPRAVQNISVHGALKTVMLANLEPYGEYKIDVAAVNEHGVGIASSVIGG